MKNITLIPQRFGQLLNGVDKTPSIIKRNLYKHKNLNFTNINLLQVNNIIDSSQNFLNILDDNKQVFYNNSMILSENKFNINIGGDHSIALGTVASSIEKYKEDLIVFWIDAHADINSYDKSLTKNVHGMPLYYLTHGDNYIYESWIADNQLDFKNLFYFGIRDLDDFEIKTVNDKDIWNYNKNRYTHETNFINHIEIIKETIKGKKIHLSIDVDALDPIYIPCTGTPVPDGLSLNYLLKLIEIIKPNLVNVDIVELNLELGNEDDKEKSLKNTMIILESLLK